jgi:hypothetical protein
MLRFASAAIGNGKALRMVSASFNPLAFQSVLNFVSSRWAFWTAVLATSSTAS